MENNVDNTVTEMVQPSQKTINVVPKLSRLATEKIAQLVETDNLPTFHHPLLASYSNEIFEILRENKKLCERTLKIMDRSRFQINKIDLMGNKVCQDDLIHCAQHNLKAFRLGDIEYLPNTNKIQISDVLSKALNDDTRKYLKHLDLSGRNRISSNWPGYVSRQFPNLESLSFANRSTANDTLSMIGANLKNLRYLDISNTYVTDISCLSEMKNLEVLIMYNLNILKGDVTETLSNLTKLRVLDISRKVNSDYLQETSQDAHLDVALGIFNRSVKAIESGTETPWAELRAIDMSGLSIVQFGTDRALEFVRKIIEAHPRLQQIALLATPLDSQTVEIADRNLKVINASCRKSVLFALSHYANLDRPAFTAHALHSVYYLLQSGYDKFTQDELGECVRLVCLSMQRYLTTLAVQIAGSACLYHLCKMKRIKRLSVKDVCNCIERSLDAAEFYKSMTQLQKNVWLTICNDYLLHLDGVDFYRTCKVALDTMLSNRDLSVERMTIAIVSIVTPKMRPREAKSLTADDRYVRHLVKIMHDYLENHYREARNIGPPLANERDNDNTLYTLKFTLSALWNLTDECYDTCHAFLKADGIRIAFQILDIFSTHGNVQTKVLGILNNVVEIEAINLSHFRDPHYIEILLDCLDGDYSERDAKGRYRDVERSYFAAGVLANLLVDSIAWPTCETREHVCEKLIESISLWPELPSAMVSYRSFNPFCRIVESSNSSGAVMWCLWGVYHVLTHRLTNDAPHCEKGYIQMLKQSKMWEMCQKLARYVNSNFDLRVVQLSQKIVDIVEHSS
ncbi:unnamed protein product [Caenorhabditis angaria]|uniref:Uncharacterized protein n=1 Tax=Caenorhabditis angaria TaxID=860376 RepID=A0A9P1IC13_9PELO|nr:unnamed protein product [Caenorhabditis angaria]